MVSRRFISELRSLWIDHPLCQDIVKLLVVFGFCMWLFFAVTRFSNQIELWLLGLVR